MLNLTASPRSLAHRVAGLTLSLTLALAGCAEAPEVEILQAEVSPDGTKVATSFYCQGGGAAGYSFHNVTLTPVDEAVDPFDGLLGKHKSWNTFVGIGVTWLDNENLEVTFSAHGDDAEQLSTRVATSLGVDLHYVFQSGSTAK